MDLEQTNLHIYYATLSTIELSSQKILRFLNQEKTEQKRCLSEEPTNMSKTTAAAD